MKNQMNQKRKNKELVNTDPNVSEDKANAELELQLEEALTKDTIKRLQAFENDVALANLNAILQELKDTNTLLAQQLEYAKTQSELLVALTTNMEELNNLLTSSIHEAAQSMLPSPDEEQIFSFENTLKIPDDKLKN